MSDAEEKTLRVGIVSVAAVILGIAFLAVKADACAGCNAPSTPTCHDEFHEFTSNTHSHACDQGAVAEVVNSPPAPKAGILCHCPPRLAAPPATSASAHP